MKKLFILVAALSLGTAMTSCKKDYVCKCSKTYTKANGNSTTVSDDSYTFKDTKVRAEDKCNQQETTGSDVIMGDYTRECQIQ